MIDALIMGRIHGQPTERTTGTGSPYATAVIRVSARTGEGYFVNAIGFEESAVVALLALTNGDSAALSGELTPKARIDKEGTARPVLDLLVHAVLTEFHVSRKRRAVKGEAP